MKYKHVQANTPEELTSKVQDLLDAGWVICGTPYQVDKQHYQCVTTAPEVEPSDDGLTADDIATISLIRGLGRRGRRF